MSEIKEIVAAARPVAPEDLLTTALAPADGLCSLCRGAGNLLRYQDGEREFWECPACGGWGVRKLHGQPTVRMKGAKSV